MSVVDERGHGTSGGGKELASRPVEQAYVGSIGGLVEVTAGCAAGRVGTLLSLDPEQGVAQVRFRLVDGCGYWRSGVAVVAVSEIRVADAKSAPKRGRPRIITDDMLEKIAAMYETGKYSHAAISAVLGVSKTSVSEILRKRAAANPQAER